MKYLYSKNRSPNSSVDNNDKLNNALPDVTKDKSLILIAGKFNYPELQWDVGTSSPDSNNEATKFMEATRGSFLTQHITEPTHFRGNQVPSTLDLMFINEDNMIAKVFHLAPIAKITTRH